VRLDGVDITTQGGTINNIAANGREVDVTIPPSFLAVPHHYALDVLSNGAASNVADFIVIESVDLSKVCSSSGSPVNTMPSSVAIADQIANGPFSPFALVSVTGCNSVVKVDLNPASPTFGQLLGSPVLVGATPQGIAISQQLGLAVVANHGTNTASILDLTQNPVVQKVPDVVTGTSPTGVAVDDVIGVAVVANTGANTASVINLASLFPPAGTTPPTTPTITSVGGFQQPIAVAIDPDRGANNQGIAVVSGVQLASGTAPSGSLNVVEIGLTPPILSKISPSGFVTSIPTGVVFDPTVVVTGATNPGIFYSNSSGSNTLVQFNPDTGGGSSVNVGVNPTSLAINPQTGAILTSNSAGNTISIVDTISNPIKTVQSLGLPGSPTFGVAIDQFTNLAIIVDQANMRVLLFPMPN
jgi:DNA-binding beta-propeller fold protein YncE